MPTDLAALLVEEGAVAADAMERALARQREAGGALDTALLELGLLDEDTLVGALSRAASLPPAPPGAWDGADPRARRVFPSRVAERHGLAPFALDGRELALVATYPVDLGLLDEISFMLSLHLAPHVGPEWRVRALIHRLYGGALPARVAALESGGAPLAAADGASPSAAGSGPAPEEREAAPAPATASSAADGPGAGDTDFGDAAAPDGAAGPAPEAPPARGFARDLTEPLDPLAAALAAALESEDFPWGDEAEDAAAAPGAPPGAGPRAATDGDPAASAPPGAAPEPAPEYEPEPPPPPPDRSAPPRWSFADAQAALAAARSRDGVVLAALRYARDSFEFAALFAVTRDAIAGHDALGPEEGARELCRGVAFYAEEPGTFRTVIEACAPYLGPIAPDPAGNAAILGGLGRGTPRTVLVYPVLLRDRPVAVLYADNGEAPVSPRRLGDLLLLLSTVGPAFERVIKDRKTRRRPRRPPAAAPPPAPAPAPEPEPESAPAPEPWTAVAGPPAPAAPPSGRVGPPDDDPWLATEPARVAPPAPADAIEVDVELGDDAASGPDAAVEALVATEAGSDARAAALARLVATGAAAIPALAARFPGPADPGAEDGLRGPIPAALMALGAAAVPALLALLGDPEPARRRAAALLLGAAGDPATFPALGERALDADRGVAAAAAAALGAHRRDPAMRAVPEKLRRAVLSGVSARTAGAARALGALRDTDAIPLLMQVLEAPDRDCVEAAAEALAAVTLQRLGTDARRWFAWWRENRGRGRAEWLFAGLGSPDREVRVAAAEELSQAAPPPVPYSPDAPPAERASAARAWAGWWSRSGRVL